ncbi:MAG: four-carbon acid sugar kinase family protein [Rhizobiales bacterium]|nr:four-carbon acid sugar kinase family protein [Hyphomicrobiales bacterium]
MPAPAKLLTYYGDDFTGSTDVMEALAIHGVKTLLYTRLPSAAEALEADSYQAIGLAGISRSQSPEWMDTHLPGIYAWLKSLQARFCHYKVCSTFDSSPQVGSIGRAIDVGASCFSQATIPLIVGAPQLRRYTFAGNLFAGYQGETFRIDRHPVMSRHPVTPMTEADLRIHLGRQTAQTVTLANHEPTAGIVLFDVHDAATQRAAGDWLLSLPEGALPFVAGSSGVEYALMKALEGSADVPGSASFAPLEPLSQVAVVSGSVSPTTERQIKYAGAHGFDLLAIDTLALARREPSVIASAVHAALRSLGAGRSPLVHTAAGPSTDLRGALDAIPGGRENIGVGLGVILRDILQRNGLRRAIVAGGDSSSHALGQLDIFALSTRLPLPESPGSPLCRTHSANPQFARLEIALKGGQVGRDDYFVRLRDGLT